MNDGLLREDEVVFDLNNRKIKDLSNNMHTLVRNLFGVLDEENYIKCYKVDDSFKTDFVIEYGDDKRNISMKSGRAEIVHNEILANFIEFLRGLGISEKTLETIKLYHYGDGTTDGSGQKRLGYKDVVNMLGDRIKEANSELNASLTFVEKVVKRCVFKGSYEENLEADAIYFGDRNYGIMATKRQIMKHLSKRGFDFYNNLHIGPLLLRPDARYVDRDINYERKRQRIVAYWPHLNADIDFISRHYNY